MGEDKIIHELDVICLHKKDGSVIPMRIRLADDEGELHAYTIQGYKDLSYKGEYTMPNGVTVTKSTMVFECHIIVFRMKKTIRLYYDTTKSRWWMAL